MIAGTVCDGRQEAGQASVSCWRSKKEGQVFYERGPHGTCQTCVGQAPSASQRVSMHNEADMEKLMHCFGLKKRGVHHLGQETPTELPKGHKWTDRACQYGNIQSAYKIDRSAAAWHGLNMQDASNEIIPRECS